MEHTTTYYKWSTFGIREEKPQPVSRTGLSAPLYLISDSDSFALSDGQFVVSGLSSEVIQNLHLQGDRSMRENRKSIGREEEENRKGIGRE